VADALLLLCFAQLAEPGMNGIHRKAHDDAANTSHAQDRTILTRRRDLPALSTTTVATDRLARSI
jgi:hypothetical protein